MSNNLKKDLTGKVTFDYSKNNGLFFIGEDEYRFGLKVSKASNSAIHFYNDDPSITGIALIKNVFSLNAVDYFYSYDMTSRSQCPEIGDIVLLKNKYNKVGAVKILGIKDNSRGDNTDELEIEYAIIVEKPLKYFVYKLKSILRKSISSLWFAILYPIIIAIIASIIFEKYIRHFYEN